MNLRSEFIKLLKEDEEFRYLIIGLLGLEDLRSSIKELAREITKLIELQSRTEERLSRLEEAFIKAEERLSKVEGRLDRLEEAFIKAEERLSRLEESVNKLSESVRGLSKEVGKLSDVVGFGLEDVARVVVPEWLYRHEGILVGDLERRFFFVDGFEVEVNLYGEGVREGVRVVVLGEAKSRIFRSDVERFHENIERLRKVIRDNIYPLMFAFYIHPTAQEEAKTRKITLIASYMK